jgi:HPt (histidine-containing phosphotransfer) domain-containing protein
MGSLIMNASPLDPAVIAELRALSGPGEDLLAEIAGVFAEDTPPQIEALRAALAGGDAALAQRVAHRLKGTANGVGARAMGDVAAGVESAARAGDVGRAADAAQALEAAFRAARAALERETGRT